MKYRVEHSKSKEFRVYRKFNYVPNFQLGVRGFLSVVFLSLGILLLVPDVDDVFVYGIGAATFSKIFGISVQRAFLLSASIYKGAGLLFLVIALIFGGRYIKDKLKMQVKSHAKKIGHIRNKLSACF